MYLAVVDAMHAHSKVKYIIENPNLAVGGDAMHAHSKVKYNNTDVQKYIKCDPDLTVVGTLCIPHIRSKIIHLSVILPTEHYQTLPNFIKHINITTKRYNPSH